MELLSETNRHPRDARITFKEEGHQYTLEGCDQAPISVTTLIHHWFPVFDKEAVAEKLMKGRNWEGPNISAKQRPRSSNNGMITEPRHLAWVP